MNITQEKNMPLECSVVQNITNAQTFNTLFKDLSESLSRLAAQEALSKALSFLEEDPLSVNKDALQNLVNAAKKHTDTPHSASYESHGRMTDAIKKLKQHLEASS